MSTPEQNEMRIISENIVKIAVSLLTGAVIWLFSNSLSLNNEVQSQRIYLERMQKDIEQITVTRYTNEMAKKDFDYIKLQLQYVTERLNEMQNVKK